MPSARLSAVILLLLLLICEIPFFITVSNTLDPNGPSNTYNTSVPLRGILLGGLIRLRDSNQDFTFTYTDDKNFGPFLQSVNGLVGNFHENTFWKLQVKTAENGTITPDVGIGCYIPNANDEILLKFSML